MRKLVYYVGASIDGYIAGPDGQSDFFPFGGEKQDAEYSEWVNARYPETVPTVMRPQAGLVGAPNQRFDTVVMGLGSYQPALNQGIPSPYKHMRQYVVSSSLGHAPDPAVTVIGDPLGLVRSLKKEKGKDIWLCGGGRLAGSVLTELDELIVKSYPVVAGGGTPMFDGPFDPTRFSVTTRESFANDVTITWLKADR
ncbi:dihydrofolate reductase family protein [Streptomyces canus]|uniref:dihydrofolate reductase family protein n=1 Tax=Streptomyces canus TaxID=58343 RepID=UPI002E26485A|nr:dihydrofolate reductase family protein [Streptomyces canus]